MITAESPAVMMSDLHELPSPIQCYSEVNKVDVPSQLVAVTYKIIKWEDKKSELVTAEVFPHISHFKNAKHSNLHTCMY